MAIFDPTCLFSMSSKKCCSNKYKLIFSVTNVCTLLLLIHRSLPIADSHEW